jgi:hypothetical protein
MHLQRALLVKMALVKMAQRDADWILLASVGLTDSFACGAGPWDDLRPRA